MSILIIGPTPSFQRRMVLKRIDFYGVNRTEREEVLPSGKGVNCLRAIHRLKGDAHLLLFLGGMAGKWMAREISREGLKFTMIPSKSATRACITLQETKGGITELVNESLPVTPREIRRFLSVFKKQISRHRYMVCLGSLPPGARKTFYGDMVRDGNRKGVKAIVDAQGDVLLNAVRKKPLVAKCNADELRSTLGLQASGKKSLRQGMNRLIRMGAQWVLITRGPEKTLLTNGMEWHEIRSPRIKVGNPIGAGDTLSGALALGLARGLGMVAAAKWAVVIASGAAAGEGYGRVVLARIPKGDHHP